MQRRDFIALLSGVFSWPFLAHAQQKAMRVIGLLGVGPPPLPSSLMAAFRQGLSETGYIEGQNVAIEYRFAEGRYDRLPALAADLVGRQVDLIFTSGGLPSALAARNATSTIPIVFGSGDDPVAGGLVASLARPGGNVTGFSILLTELTPKRFQLLSELVPQVDVFAVLVNQNNAANAEGTITEAQRAARAKALQLHILKASTEAEIDAGFGALVELHAGALVVGDDPLFFRRREQLAALAARHAIPAIYPFREVADIGGLMSYGASVTGTWRQVGVYAGKILNGAKPADLPVQQPTTFELVVNLRTANALGLTVPPSILARADEVIE
jgi:putative tryptophan/tyrosine transport system substrate-binding protein